jgi:hypothetical protein
VAEVGVGVSVGVGVCVMVAVGVIEAVCVGAAVGELIVFGTPQPDMPARSRKKPSRKRIGFESGEDVRFLDIIVRIRV